MKKVIIISFVLMQLFSCNKEKQHLDNIIAGKTEGVGIKYSGVINDTLHFEYPSSNTNRFIDINNDGVNDFELMFYGSASPGHKMSYNSISTIGNSFLHVQEFGNNVIDTLSLNDTIDNTLNWVKDTCVLFSHNSDASGSFSETGLWNYVSNKFIGTKIIIDEKEYFGWIRIEIPYIWNLTLVDYGCTVPY